MARLFPLRSETPSPEGKPRVVDLEDEDADAVFSALSSTTARRIYSRLSEEPGTPSDVAEAIDSSIQNVRYHLEKLEDAGLVEVVDTWYSSRGNEMSVYATADGPLIVTSDQSKAAQLREALSRFLGGLAVLGGASLFVQYGLDNVLSGFGSFGFGADDAGQADHAAGNGNGNGAAGDGAAGGRDEGEDADAGAFDAEVEREAEDDAATTGDADDGATGMDLEDEAEPTGGTETVEADAPELDPTSTPTEYAADAADAAEGVLATVPPGLLFFLGGLLVLTVATVWWYRSTY